MHVEVNETNIAVFDLVQLTGNSKEDLLEAAENAKKDGYTLSCQIPEPEDNKIEVNAFEHFASEPAPKITCRYELKQLAGENMGEGYVCIIHGHTSKHQINGEESVSPCLFMDPHEKSSDG